MLEREIRINNPLGLHARAAAQLVRLSNQFKCTVMLIRDDSGVTANAKSILSVLNIAASIGTYLRIQADGIDEADAILAVENLFRRGFGEIISDPFC